MDHLRYVQMTRECFADARDTKPCRRAHNLRASLSVHATWRWIERRQACRRVKAEGTS